MAKGGLSSEQQARRLAVKLSASFRRDDTEKILIVTIGKRRQRFWLGSWPTITEWLKTQQSTKRRRG